MTDKEREKWLSWAAGFIDGEGTIGIQHAHGKFHEVYLDVGQAEKRMDGLYILQGLFGGTFIKAKKLKEHHSQAWRWRVTGWKAVKACQELEPYLVLKQPQATIVSEFATTMRTIGGNRGKSMTEDEQTNRESMKERLHVLNRKGDSNG